MTTINIMQKAIKMSNIVFILNPNSTEMDNKECKATWIVADKTVSLEFKDTNDAFAMDDLLRLAYETGRKKGVSEATHSIQTAINNIY